MSAFPLDARGNPPARPIPQRDGSARAAQDAHGGGSGRGAPAYPMRTQIGTCNYSGRSLSSKYFLKRGSA